MNTTRKLMLVSASTALSFLLIMGLNTAFSANPTAVPPETGLTPTFNGMTIENSSGDDVVKVDPTASGMVPSVQIGRSTGADFIKLFGTLESQGSSISLIDGIFSVLKQGVGTYFKIDTTTTIPSATPEIIIGVSGKTNTEMYGLTDFKDGEVYVRGNLSTYKNADASQNGDLDVQGALYVNDSSATGTLFEGNVNIGTNVAPKNFTVWGTTTNNGTITNTNTTTFKAGVTIGENKSGGADPLTVYGATTIGSSTYNGSLTVNGNSTINGNLSASGSATLPSITGPTTISGSLKATNIGKFEYPSTEVGDVPASSTLEKTAGCGAGKKIMGCMVQGASRYALEVNGTKIDSNGLCWAWVTNKTASAQKMWITLSCFDPNSN